jgi:hypothetical protein
MRRRRELNVFSWSFLDAITCGFGAVVLTFVIVSAQVADRRDQSTADLKSETTRIQEEVLEARKNLVRLRNSRRDEEKGESVLAAEAVRLTTLLARLKDQQAKEGDTVARRESIEQLRADVKQLEEANRRLAARNKENSPNTGERIRSFVGEGNRQYLTGIRMGGSRVLILLDASASMLGRTYVNVIRFRSMPDDRRRRAPKWQQAVRTVDWLTAQMKPGTKVQIYVFNEQPHSVVDGSDGRWIDVKDGSELTAAIASLRKVVPGKGTSLINAFGVIKALDPQPDNVFLITDGLPTQGEKPPSETEDVRPERRVKFMVDAVRSVPRRLPVNVILFPMDGDPQAAGYFWEFAIASGGSLITPSRDWP